MEYTYLVICFIKAILAYCTTGTRDPRFTITRNRTVTSSHYTTDVFSESHLMCAMMCSSQDKCCVASFSQETSICRLDTTDNCCVATDMDVGWSTVAKSKYGELNDNVHFENNYYYLIICATWSTTFLFLLIVIIFLIIKKNNFNDEYAFRNTIRLLPKNSCFEFDFNISSGICMIDSFMKIFLTAFVKIPLIIYLNNSFVN